ncbi:hypothetical protein JXL19_13025 [bacterium]|nr:hypothetical protein [bacterium]
MNTKQNTKGIPGGISLIGGLNIIAGIIMMIMAINSDQAPLLFIGGIASIIIAFGLLLLKPWGRYCAIVCYAGNIIMCISEENFLGLIIPIGIISYLFSDKVKAAFAKKTREAVLTNTGLVQPEDKTIEA